MVSTELGCVMILKVFRDGLDGTGGVFQAGRVENEATSCPVMFVVVCIERQGGTNRPV